MNLEIKKTTTGVAMNEPFLKFVWKTSFTITVIASFLLPSVLVAQDETDSKIKVTSILGGTEMTAQVSIDQDGNVFTTESVSSRPIDEFQRIEFPTSEQQPASYQVGLRSGGSLFTSEVLLANEECQIVVTNNKVTIPLSALAFIRFANDEMAGAFKAAVAEPSNELDQVFLRVDNSVQGMSAVVDSFKEKTLAMYDEDNQSYNVPVRQLYGIAFADLLEEPIKRGAHTVTLVDGSELNGTITSLNEDAMGYRTPDGLEFEFPRSRLKTIQIRSGRLVFLSDMEPTSSVTRPIITGIKNVGRNTSVEGNPLTLRLGEDEIKTFRRGFGVHSESRMSFANDGYDSFAATIGIDTETNGHGKCVFVVLGDGKELFSKALTGQDNAVDVNLSIDGVQEITLWVQPGDDLDLADHANWCDARLFRTESGE